MLCTVKAPLGIAASFMFAGKQVLVQPGTSQQVDLTGDEIGAAEAALQQIHTDRNIPLNARGGVYCPEREASDANPPVGSKKHRALYPTEYEAGGEFGPAKKTKAELRAQAEVDAKAPTTATREAGTRK